MIHHKREAHSDLRTFPCTECNEKCFTNEHLRKHLNDYHSPAICEYLFLQKIQSQVLFKRFKKIVCIRIALFLW